MPPQTCAGLADASPPCSPEPGTNNLDELTRPLGSRDVHPDELSPGELAADVAPLQTADSGTIRGAIRRADDARREHIRGALVNNPRRALKADLERKPMTEALAPSGDQPVGVSYSSGRLRVGLVWRGRGQSGRYAATKTAVTKIATIVS